MNREQRAAHAAQHYEDIKVRLAPQTEDSIAKTVVYGPTEQTKGHSIGRFRNKITLVDKDSVSCLFDMPIPTGSKVCVLNYASYKNPGGFFLGGSAAQEEALCHESNLYPILLSFDGTYYDWNRRHLNKALYLNTALYTPNVVFEHDGKTMVADVLTCAAPNFRTAHTYQGVGTQLNNDTFFHRLEFIGDILEEQGVDVFITGAWGCGVFMQDPEMVCEATTAILGRQRNIPQIYYAIPDRNSKNFKGFLETLQEFSAGEQRLTEDTL